MDALAWIADPARWPGPDGIATRLAEHLGYSVAGVLIACLVGIPAGWWVGHTRRGRGLAVGLSGAARALPTLGLVTLLGILLGIGLVGPMVAFVVLALPSVLAGAYSGVDEVDPLAKDAARGMGMSSREVLFGVEIPCALPLIFSGIRSAALQVVATATIAAAVSVGGLGRYLIDGQATRDYGQMAAGAVLVAVLAVLVDLGFAIVQRFAVSPGLIAPRRRRRPATPKNPTPASQPA